MPKYYVKSNQLRVVIDAESPRFAALESLDVISRTPTTDSLSLGHHFEVGERGFETPPSHLFDVEEIVTEAGWECEDE